MITKIRSILFLLLIFFSSNLYCNEDLKLNIYKNLRCLVCQGQTIADSNSEFAQIIKSVVSDKINEGMDENQIYNFLSDKYGDWILYKPPLKDSSLLLWSLPYIIFVIGALIILIIFKKRLIVKK
mgnify:CR=1 FL=1|tara:strand:+ start:4096 stop:4470 length:375 start_codon:yes stop_codon:yes gene_type:complete